MFNIEWKSLYFCFSVDASKEDESLGRLVNDNHKSPNAKMKKMVVENRPHLCLFAIAQIKKGDEIEYDYGDSNWPWREKVCWLFCKNQLLFMHFFQDFPECVYVK